MSAQEVAAPAAGMRALIDAHDWAATPLGPMSEWPRALRLMVDLMLRSRAPQYLAWGDDQCFLYNDAFLPVMGIKHPHGLGRPFAEVWPEVWDAIGPLAASTYAGEASYFENRPFVLRRHGIDELTWFSFSYTPLEDDQGATAGLLCVLMETTARVIAERDRQEQISRMRRLFQQTPGFMCVTRGPAHVFELANEAYLALVGGKDVIGLAVAEALPEVVEQGFVALLDRVYASGEAFVGRAVPVQLRRQAGGTSNLLYLDFIYQPIVEPDGRISGIFIQGADVTDRMRAEAELRAGEARVRAILDASPQMVWASRADGAIEYCNRQWRSFTGEDTQPGGGAAWEALVHPEDFARTRSAWHRSLETETDYECEFRLRHASGEYRWLLARAVPLRDEAGQVTRWMGMCIDLHEQRMAQTALRRSEEALREANKRKDEFLAMLAHELRNPLAPISTAAELLRLAVGSDERVIQCSDIISRQVQHMKTLVDDLLDVSRVTRGLVELQRETLDLREIARAAVEQVRPLLQARRHLLDVQLGVQPLWVDGDRTRLVQVVANLLGNAAKYTPQAGTIALEARADGDAVILGVRDTGIGIAPALLPHVFDLFTQAARTPDRAQGGLGIGLALVRSLTALHGGRVEASSDGPDMGSLFRVVLPRVEAPRASPTLSAHPGASGDARPLRVVVVDDNHDAAQTLVRLLEGWGHEALALTSAPQALEHARACNADVYILDIGLPGMTGYELAGHLRAIPARRHAALFALSGYGQAEDRAASVAAGFERHFTKPVASQALYDALEAVGRARATPE